MVLYERCVDHLTVSVGSAGLISALAIDCINLSYFRDWRQTAEGHIVGTQEVFACDMEKDINVNL